MAMSSPDSNSLATSAPVTGPTVGAVDFQFDDPAFQADPYPTYALLREREPIWYRETEDYRGFWLSRYDDVVTVLRDPRFSAARAPADMLAPGVPEKFRRLGHMLTHMMLLKDPPDHTRLRGLVNKALTPRVVEGMRSRVEAIVDSLLGAVLTRGQRHMDVIRDLATPLPVVVIAELLGVSLGDQWRFKQWSDDIAVVLDGSVRTAGLPQAAESASELAEYLRDVIQKRRSDPREDLLSGLIAARDEGDSLSDDELIANCVLLLLAGHETTTNLIGNGVLALLRHPDQMALLRGDHDLAQSAVEECLRYDSPVQLTSREPLEDVALFGARIDKGVEVNVSLGSANRDPAHFEHPERFDITRTENRHLSFGYGAHFCIGAPLARLEGEIALRTLVTRLPQLELELDDPPRRAGLVLRGLSSLPVSF